MICRYLLFYQYKQFILSSQAIREYSSGILIFRNIIYKFIMIGTETSQWPENPQLQNSFSIAGKI